MSTLHRIKEFIDYKNITVKDFEIKVGFSNGAFGSQLRNNKTIGVDKLENILLVYSEINPEWLLTGKGEMLKNTINNINQKVKGDNNIITGQNKGHIQSTTNNKDDIISNLQQHLINYKNIIDEKDQQINKLLEVINKITK